MSVTVKVNLPIITTGRMGAARKLQVIVGQRTVNAEIAELPATEALVAAEFPLGHVRANAANFYRRVSERTVSGG